MKKPQQSESHTTTPFDRSTIDTLLRLWTLRLLVPLEGYREFVCTYGFGDEALAQYLGLAVQEGKYDMAIALATLRELHQQAERDSIQPALPDLFRRNIERISHLLELDCTAQRILVFVVLLHTEPWLQRASRQVGRVNVSRLIEVLTVVLGLQRHQVRHAVQPEAALNASGLLRTVRRAGEDLLECLSLLSEAMADRMLYVDADAINLLGDIVAQGDPPRLALSDYGHLPILQVLQPYLRQALDTRRPGVNVLIYGVPGSGKTQMVGALAHSVGCELFAVAAQGPVGEAFDGDSRLRAYRVAQGVLQQRRAVILFDETEDVFNDGLSPMLGKGTARSRKAWMNRILETNAMPAFWLTNAVGTLDPAFVRRFDVVVEAALPAGRVRQAMFEQMCGDFIPAKDLAPLMEAPWLAPAVVERAASVIRCVANNLPREQTGSALRQLVDGTLAAQGHATLMAQGAASRLGRYDPDLVSTDTDLGELTRGLQQAGAGRLCLYGPPGTGKTAYGQWLAQQLDRPLHARRVSDLVTPYVGETEQNLARAFKQATQEHAVLMIDEVDSFLRDRRHAQRSWEITAVNEMLVQIEAFDGVLIASTNLMDDLDQAALRRFDLKVRFNHLAPAQAWRLLQCSCETLGIGEPTAQDQNRLRALSTLTPGDFAAVERQHRFRRFSEASMLVTALAAECAMKKASAPRSMGFMATAD